MVSDSVEEELAGCKLVSPELNARVPFLGSPVRGRLGLLVFWLGPRSSASLGPGFSLAVLTSWSWRVSCGFSVVNLLRLPGVGVAGWRFSCRSWAGLSRLTVPVYRAAVEARRARHCACRFDSMGGPLRTGTGRVIRHAIGFPFVCGWFQLVLQLLVQ